ncbi:MAG: NADH-quinone oxidoreductase subunit H [candidate division Zixibacteria bacterium]|nr:NADH-quinone oxidoreductase subunit H [candidate division Zixibacteria bacterium]
MSFVIGAALGTTVFIIMFVLSLAGLLTWVERKQSAIMQDRIGANRAPILGLRLWGLFHIIADAVKMFTKEDFVPETPHRFLHAIAPVLAIFFALLSFAVIPFGNQITIAGHSIGLQVVDLNAGLLFIFAMMSVAVYGVVLAGWSSNNNYSLLGGIRASAQMISYEITIGLTLVGLLLVYQTLSLAQIVKAQGGLLWGFLPAWGIFFQPLGFLLFLTAGIAETKRIPFDLPEGESEIIGFFVEYSSMKFGMFMFADFIETVLIAALVTTFFFGGWQVPYLADSGFVFPWGSSWHLGMWMVEGMRVGAFILKVLSFCWLLMLIRWTLPRFRFDQLMHLGWKILLPLSLANTLATAAIVLWLGK